MAQFSVGAPEFERSRQSSFGEFITIASGRSIISGADWGPERIELGLSGDAMIRVFWTSGGLNVNFISTTNLGEIPPLMLKFAGEESRVPMRIIEHRLHAIRSIHAIVHLLVTGRAAEVQRGILADSAFDFESLLPDEELLYVESLAPGSWYITLWTKARESYKSLLAGVAMVYGRGREALLSKLEAEARLKQLEVEEREFKLLTERFDYGLGLLDRVASEPAKQKLRGRIEEEIAGLLDMSKHSAEVKTATNRLLENSLENHQKA